MPVVAPRQDSDRHGRPRRRGALGALLVALLAVAALAMLAACSSGGSTSGGSSGSGSGSASGAPSSSGTLSVADKNTFSSALIDFTGLEPKVVDQISTAQGNGDWSAAESGTAPIIAQMNEKISTMQAQIPKMPAAAQSVANSIVLNATNWVKAAGSAISSGKGGNDDALKASLAQISSLGDEMKAMATQWDAVPAG